MVESNEEPKRKRRAMISPPKTLSALALGAGAGIFLGAVFGNPGAGMVLGAGLGLLLGKPWAMRGPG